MSISKINMDTLQKPINQLRNSGHKRASLAKVRNLCSLLCHEAIGMGILQTNYGHYIQLPKDDTTSAQPFDLLALQLRVIGDYPLCGWHAMSRQCLLI